MLVMSASVRRLRLAAIVLIMVLILTIPFYHKDDNAHYAMNAGAWKPVFETVHESWQGGSISVIYGEFSCAVQVTSVKIGSGSWDSADWGKKIREAYRPKYEISNPLMVANGASHTGFLVVTAGGVVSVKNMGASGSSDTRNGSVCWPVERRY